jgi:hypothetical protein
MKIMFISVVREESVGNDSIMSDVGNDVGGLLLEEIGDETLSEVLDGALDHVSFLFI